MQVFDDLNIIRREFLPRVPALFELSLQRFLLGPPFLFLGRIGLNVFDGRFSGGWLYLIGFVFSVPTRFDTFLAGCWAVKICN